jgi:hypothetical protein
MSPVDNDEVLLLHFNPEVKDFSPFGINDFPILGYILAEYFFISYKHNLVSHYLFLLSRATLLTRAPE